MRMGPSLGLIALLLAPACKSGGVEESAPHDPPAVLLGDAELHCTIDWDRDGAQTLIMKSGAGLSFDVAVSPIVDGTATLLGPERGGEYRFTSHLAKPATGTISGVGEVTIEALETKVSVGLEGYAQPAGPGSPITFDQDQVKKADMYVEFTGSARAQDGKRYGFRVTFGALKDGSGRVVPSDANTETRLMSKMVVVEAPITTVIEARTELTPL